MLNASHIEQAFLSGRTSVASAPSPTRGSARVAGQLLRGLATLNTGGHGALVRLVRDHHGSRQELARQLGISERSWNRKLKTLK